MLKVIAAFVAAFLGWAFSRESAAVVSKTPAIDSPGSKVENAGSKVSYATTQSSRSNEEKYRPIIADAEKRYGIPEGLLHRQIFEESGFRSEVILGQRLSSKGAMGIAQIVPRYHPGVDPLDAPAAIYYAAKYMAELYNQFGSWRLALAGYNAGPGNVTQYKGIPPFPETQKYVAQITNDVEVV